MFSTATTIAIICTHKRIVQWTSSSSSTRITAIPPIGQSVTLRTIFTFHNVRFPSVLLIFATKRAIYFSNAFPFMKQRGGSWTFTLCHTLFSANWIWILARRCTRTSTFIKYHSTFALVHKRAIYFLNASPFMKQRGGCWTFTLCHTLFSASWIWILARRCTRTSTFIKYHSTFALVHFIAKKNIRNFIANGKIVLVESTNQIASIIRRVKIHGVEIV